MATTYSNADLQVLYDHLLACAEKESPSQMIERCRQLFIDGLGYADRNVEAALYRIIPFIKDPEEFNYILNRCCYILINHWDVNNQRQTAIPKLIALFNTPSHFTQAGSRSRVIKRLQDLVNNFTHSDAYQALQRLGNVAESHSQEKDSLDLESPAVEIIYRYPYLYNYALLTNNSSPEEQATIRELQVIREQELIINLSAYANYLVQKVKTAHQQKTNQNTSISPIIKPINNPTLLTDKELYQSLKTFVGKVEDSHTYKESADLFLKNTKKIKSYKTFKACLYDYLIMAINPQYGQHKFNKRLSDQLNKILPKYDTEKVTETLMQATYCELFNFLVVESFAHRNHYVFLDLVQNMGPLGAITLLLKIALLSQGVKPELEKRFAILFNHYENDSINSISWLIKSMENLNVGLIANFHHLEL